NQVSLTIGAGFLKQVAHVERDGGLRYAKFRRHIARAPASGQGTRDPRLGRGKRKQVHQQGFWNALALTGWRNKQSNASAPLAVSVRLHKRTDHDRNSAGIVGSL